MRHTLHTKSMIRKTYSVEADTIEQAEARLRTFLNDATMLRDDIVVLRGVETLTAERLDRKVEDLGELPVGQPEPTGAATFAPPTPAGAEA